MAITHAELEGLCQKFEAALLNVDRITTRELFASTHENFTPLQFVEKLVVPVLARIGSGWENGSYSLSQVYMSGRICEELVDLILPPDHENRTRQPKIAIATLEDFHVLGKRIVHSTLRACGFEVLDFGRMATKELAERVVRDEIKILLISVLMLPSALKIKNLRELFRSTNTQVNIIVGGAPFQFDNQLWQEVHADAVGQSAIDAVEIVQRMIKEVS
ncbi:MAG: cobalamin-binding protein [Chloroflexi bacterium HGW-Chloroflexi-10]|nr:MAG: cobalamin-binding protein [Chloroflexi bacterium HGW-Chloroflexi-10]